jgi:hypothetical protein
VANAAGTEPDENFAVCGRRQVELRQLKRSADPLEDGGANLQCPSSVEAPAAGESEVSWPRSGGAVVWGSP